MYVTLHGYCVRRGEEDAIIALHEDWQRTLRSRAGGYLSGELLRDADDPCHFLEVARYESEAAAQRIARDPEQVAWQRRVESLIEGELIQTAYHCAWHVNA